MVGQVECIASLLADADTIQVAKGEQLHPTAAPCITGKLQT